MDALTNYLLTILLLLIAFIGGALYKKISDFEKRIESILLHNVSVVKDIEHLKEHIKK